MNENRDAAVTVTLFPKDSEKGFRLVSNFGTPEFGTSGTWDRLKGLRGRLPGELENAMTEAGTGLKLDWDRAGATLKALYDVGYLVLDTLMAGDNDALPELYQFMEMSVAPARDGGFAPLIEIVSPRAEISSTVVPFELLPLLAAGPPGEIRSLPQFMEAAEGLLGFSTVIAWRGRQSISPDPLLRSPNLPIKLFQHQELNKARAEIAFFMDRKEWFACKGPWPATSAADPARLLVSHIAYPQLGFEDEAPDLVDQVQHFACHCDTLPPDSLDHSFQLRSDEAGDVTITLRELKRLRPQVAGKLKPPTARPLIFFNACGTAAGNPHEIGSFVDLFLDNRNRGFIGTQTKIPDSIAAKFCELFYAALFNDATVGTAMYTARQLIARRYNNPLGILYVYYGPPELRMVSQPSARRQRDAGVPAGLDARTQ